MSNHTLPTFVIIRNVEDQPDTGRVYRVRSVLEGGARGREFVLANKRGLIERVCHAPAEHLDNLRSVRTSGEIITYCRAKSGETFRGIPIDEAVTP